jgi:hypothetical protein
VAVSDGPSGGRSFLGLFLGGISHVFSRAHKRWAPMLGFICWRLSNSNRKGKRNSNKKKKVALKAKQTVLVKSRPFGGAPAGLFIGEVKVLITIP